MAATVQKHATGIPGFDLIAEGGLPRARATLIAGSAGSAKTVLATHFLAAGIINDHEPGVFVTFEDRVEDLRANMLGFGWDIAEWERKGQWCFVDAAPVPDERTPIIGDFDLSGLLVRIEHAIRKIGAKRIALDSLNALFVQFPHQEILRAELFRITTALKRIGVTIVFTGERVNEYGEVTRHGIEEFVADNVVILRNLLDNERRRRTIEILKLRGAPHQRGEFPFTITSRDGVVVIPLSRMELTQTSSTIRVTSGNDALDTMCGGGFLRDSIVLVSGATGTGKTLVVTQFMAGGIAAGERCLLFAFEESKDQLFRNAEAWGYDFAEMETSGMLKVVNRYPHAMAMEDHLVEMQQIIKDFNPQRVAVDSLSALERVSALRSFREFVISLTSFLKQRETTGLFASTTPSLFGGSSVTEKHISTLTDSIILLRYVETAGRLRRSIVLLKMRGSLHDLNLREYVIDQAGMHIGDPFTSVGGILVGNATFMNGDGAGDY